MTLAVSVLLGCLIFTALCGALSGVWARLDRLNSDVSRLSDRLDALDRDLRG